MARVAERVGFTTMSLYRHVANKEELVWRMLDGVLGPAPEFEIPDWRAGLERWAYELRALLLRHPWGIDVPITGVLATASQLSWLDRGLQALDGTGLAPGEDADLVLLLNGYVFWAVRLEASLAAAPPAPLVPEEFDLEALPFLRRVLEAGGFEDEYTNEENFQSGLDRVLDGIGVLIARRA
jgi:AcrR family transcriptional regulator